MREWENMKLNNISQKGDQTKRSWLKRPKQQRIDSGNGSAKVQSHHSPERYFETDDGRQMTVIEHDDDDDDDRRYLASPSSPNTSSKENQWLTPHEAEYRDFEHSSSEPNLKDGSGRKATLAVTKGTQNLIVSLTFIFYSLTFQSQDATKLTNAVLSLSATILEPIPYQLPRVK